MKTMKSTMIMIGTLPHKQTFLHHKVYREVARTLAQMHSIELPEGRRSPGAFPSDLFELRLKKNKNIIHAKQKNAIEQDTKGMPI